MELSLASNNRRLWCLFLAVLLIGLALPANAVLQFDVFPGYDSNVRQAHWYPVTFEIKNDGPTFAGFIEIDATQMNRRQSRRVPIELPTGTLKRVTIPVFSSARYDSWNAQLLNERGKILERREFSFQNIKQKLHNATLVGSLARTSGGVPVFPAIKRNQQELQPAAARILPTLFPDNPIALDGLQSIYLSSERALELKVPQVQALLAWLQDGGHLILGVEQISDVKATPWLRELSPVQFASVTKVKTQNVFQRWLHYETMDAAEEETLSPVQLKNSKSKMPPTKVGALWTAAGTNIVTDSAFEGGEIEVATGPVLRGRVLASVDGVPLAVESRQGRGKITTLAFSPERQPFVGWNNRPWFWAMLTDVPARFYENSDVNEWGWSVDGLFGAMIESKQVRKLPLGWLVLLLLAYLIVIGPVDQYWLKKTNRQMLTWVTFPCYVVFFSGLIYFIGFQLRAGESEWNELNIVDVYENGDNAILRGHTFASIYSPANQRYPLESPQFIASLRGEYLANWGNGEETSQATVTCIGNKFAAEIFVPVWTSQLYVNDWWQPVDAKPVSVTFLDGEKKTVRVANNLNRKLTEARVCVNAKMYTLGELPPNGSKDFVLDEKTAQPVRDFVRNNGADFGTALERRRQTFGNEEWKRVWNLPLASMAASFITQLDEDQGSRKYIPQGGLDLSDSANGGDVVLLAWDGGQSLTEPINRFKTKRNTKNTLLRVTVPRSSEL